MSPATFWLIVFLICLVLISVLFIQKMTIGRALRIIGCAFIAAGDSVDHWGDRLRQLKAEERQARGGQTA